MQDYSRTLVHAKNTVRGLGGLQEGLWVVTRIRACLQENALTSSESMFPMAVLSVSTENYQYSTDVLCG